MALTPNQLTITNLKENTKRKEKNNEMKFIKK